MNLTPLTRIALACGIGALIFGAIATVISRDGTWLWIGVLSLLLSGVRVWLEKSAPNARHRNRRRD